MTEFWAAAQLKLSVLARASMTRRIGVFILSAGFIPQRLPWNVRKTLSTPPAKAGKLQIESATEKTALTKADLMHVFIAEHGRPRCSKGFSRVGYKNFCQTARFSKTVRVAATWPKMNWPCRPFLL